MERPSVLDYEARVPASRRVVGLFWRGVRRVRGWFSWRRVIFLGLLLTMVGGGYGVYRWDLVRAKVWRLRVLPVEGADVVRAMGLKVFKFDFTWPEGNWEAEMQWAVYQNGVAAPKYEWGAYINPQPGKTVTYLLYIPDRPGEEVRVTEIDIGGFRGGASQTFQFELPDMLKPVVTREIRPQSSSSGGFGAGTLAPNVPFGMYMWGWSKEYGRRRYKTSMQLPNANEDNVAVLELTLRPLPPGAMPGMGLVLPTGGGGAARLGRGG